MIAFFDARAGYLAHRSAIDAAIQRVLASGQLILGPEVEAFEREFAAFVGARHAIGVASGTDALTLALRALGIGPGDEVITVANAGVPPVAAIRAAGATPRFVDVLPGSLLIDPDAVARTLTARTRALVPVHLYGRPAPLDALLDIAQRQGVAIVEDCAHAHGARHRSRHVGTLGSIGCFSFYPTKNLGALGDAGMCVTDDSELAVRLRMERMYGFRNDEHAHCEGLNSRLDELQAAVLRVKLAHLDGALAARRRLADAYTDGLRSAPFRLPECEPPDEHAYHLYVIQTPARDAVQARLAQAAIVSRIHYPLPVHQMAAYRSHSPPPGALPVTERAAREVLSLPLFPELAAEDLERIVRVLAPG
jgi:dTDP-4-amino-4,6-dideoxygalactose transaminase